MRPRIVAIQPDVDLRPTEMGRPTLRGLAQIPKEGSSFNPMEPLLLAALLRSVGLPTMQELTDLATDALVRGLDSPSLRRLAGLTREDAWLEGDVFDKALNELGLEVPDEQRSLRMLAIHKAAEILSGSVAPYEGARWIWTELFWRLEDHTDLGTFVGLASEWMDHPGQRSELDRLIIEASRALVDPD